MHSEQKPDIVTLKLERETITLYTGTENPRQVERIDQSPAQQLTWDMARDYNIRPRTDVDIESVLRTSYLVFREYYSTESQGDMYLGIRLEVNGDIAEVGPKYEVPTLLLRRLEEDKTSETLRSNIGRAYTYLYTHLVP